jgi:hypothetical protein
MEMVTLLIGEILAIEVAAIEYPARPPSAPKDLET